MTIKTWESKTTSNTTLGQQLMLMQNEIDELRAALQESNALRKVLETASQWFDWFGGNNKIINVPLATDIHAAIQEVLK